MNRALFVTREVRNLTIISLIRPHTLRPAAATRDCKLFLWWALEHHMMPHPSDPIC